jgi:hypothetical protein
MFEDPNAGGGSATSDPPVGTGDGGSATTPPPSSTDDVQGFESDQPVTRSESDPPVGTGDGGDS